MTLVRRETVESFLRDLRRVLKEGGKFYLIPREKNRDALLNMDLSIKSCRQEIINLKLEDYCSGPDQDIDPKFKGVVWKFAKEICDRQVYIKIKLIDTDLHKAVSCISFHEAEYPLRNIYR